MLLAMRYRTHLPRSLLLITIFYGGLGVVLLFLNHGQTFSGASRYWELLHRSVPLILIGTSLLTIGMRFYPLLETSSESLKYGGLLGRHSVPYSDIEQISTVVCTRANRRAYPAAEVGRAIVEIDYYGFKKKAFCITHTAEFVADLAQRAPQARIEVQPPLK
jgi:hypothetical protein